MTLFSILALSTSVLSFSTSLKRSARARTKMFCSARNSLPILMALAVILLNSKGALIAASRISPGTTFGGFHESEEGSILSSERRRSSSGRSTISSSRTERERRRREVISMMIRRLETSVKHADLILEEALSPGFHHATNNDEARSFRSVRSVRGNSQNKVDDEHSDHGYTTVRELQMGTKKKRLTLPPSAEPSAQPIIQPSTLPVVPPKAATLNEVNNLSATAVKVQQTDSSSGYNDKFQGHGIFIGYIDDDNSTSFESLGDVDGAPSSSPSSPPQASGESDIKFDDCSIDAYYAPLRGTSWSRRLVTRHLTRTHRNVLDNVALVTGSDDVFAALDDLDAGPVINGQSTVYLSFENSYVVQRPSFVTWLRGDLWPLIRGLRRDSPALTDIHVKKPLSVETVDVLAGFLYGECGAFYQSTASCLRPAYSFMARDTERDDRTLAPPFNVRGDVARAILYNLVRYEGELNISLTDCEPFASNQLGYLSQLLTWHQQDPVDMDELKRNDRACSRWQGNRNIFVDFPSLALAYFGEPDTKSNVTRRYSKCGGTASPTSAPSPVPSTYDTTSPGTGTDSPSLTPSASDTVEYFEPTSAPSASDSSLSPTVSPSSLDTTFPEANLTFNGSFTWNGFAWLRSDDDNITAVSGIEDDADEEDRGGDKFGGILFVPPPRVSTDLWPVTSGQAKISTSSPTQAKEDSEPSRGNGPAALSGDIQQPTSGCTPSHSILKAMATAVVTGLITVVL